MARDLSARSKGGWNPLARWPFDWNDEWNTSPFTADEGLSVYEDDKNVYLEAAMPGIDPDNIDITYDRGTVWVRGDIKSNDDPNRKYYRRSATSYSYRVTLPTDIDTSASPTATADNGILILVFPKSQAAQPKKIAVGKKK